MVPFRGTFDHTLDAKNRLTMPSRFRDALKDGVVLATPIDQKPCVSVWRPEPYQDYTSAALEGVSPLSSRKSELERFFYGYSHETELDAAGRVMIPSMFAEPTGLSKEVVVVGVGDHLELWDRNRWSEHRPALLSGVAEVTARVDQAG